MIALLLALLLTPSAYAQFGSIAGANAAGSSCYPLSQSNAPQAAFIRSHFAFDTSMVDSKGASVATAFNNPTIVAGRMGAGAMSFNGSNQYINIADNAAFKVTRNFTFALWVNPTALTGTQGLIGRANGVNYKQGVLSTESTRVAFDYETGSNNYRLLTAANTLVNNKWQQVVLTVSSGGIIKIYVNGALVSDSLTEVAEPASSTIPTTIGRWGGDYGDRFFNGRIDELAVWHTALSAADVKNLYDLQSCGLN